MSQKSFQDSENLDLEGNLEDTATLGGERFVEKFNQDPIFAFDTLVNCFQGSYSPETQIHSEEGKISKLKLNFALKNEEALKYKLT